MRYFALFLLFVSLSVFSIGCDKGGQPSTDPSPAETGDAALEADTPEAETDAPEAETDAPEAETDAEPAADAAPAEKAEEGSSE